MRVRRIAIQGRAASELDVRAEDPDLGDLDDPDVRAVLEAWDGKAVEFSQADVERIARGLCTLANACDEIRADVEPQEARFLEHASRGLTTASSAVWGAVRSFGTGSKAVPNE